MFFFLAFKALQPRPRLVRKLLILPEDVPQGLLDTPPIPLAILRRQFLVGADDSVGTLDGFWLVARHANLLWCSECRRPNRVYPGVTEVPNRSSGVKAD